MKELGAGGGQGDLDQQHELEFYDGNIFELLLSFCETKLRHQPALLAKINRVIGPLSKQPINPLPIDAAALHAQNAVDGLEGLDELDQMPLEEFMPILIKIVTSEQATQPADSAVLRSIGQDNSHRLPKQIVSVRTRV